MQILHSLNEEMLKMLQIEFDCTCYSSCLKNTSKYYVVICCKYKNMYFLPTCCQYKGVQSEVERLSFLNSVVKSKLSANCIAGHDLTTFGVVTQMEPFLYP